MIPVIIKQQIADEPSIIGDDRKKKEEETAKASPPSRRLWRSCIECATEVGTDIF